MSACTTNLNYIANEELFCDSVVFFGKSTRKLKSLNIEQ